MLLGCLARAGVWLHKTAKGGYNLPEAVPGRGPALHAPGREGWPGAALTHVNELLLLLFSHLAETVVPARQFPGEPVQCFHSHFLHLSSLGAGAGWRQAQATDAAPSPDPG